jgi:hypothetical protein
VTAPQTPFGAALAAPSEVAAELAREGAAIASAFGAVPADAWDRPGRRSNGSVFTVDTFGRYFVHDLVHHAHDIGRALRSAPPAAQTSIMGKQQASTAGQQ